MMMEPFIRRCSRYLNGRLTEKQAFELWAEATADQQKYELLSLQLMLAAYFRRNYPATQPIRLK